MLEALLGKFLQLEQELDSSQDNFRKNQLMMKRNNYVDLHIMELTKFLSKGTLHTPMTLKHSRFSTLKFLDNLKTKY